MMRRSRPQPPCRDCKERNPGCHGKCERWAAYKEAEAEFFKKHPKPKNETLDYFVDRDVKIHRQRARKEGKHV